MFVGLLGLAMVALAILAFPLIRSSKATESATSTQDVSLEAAENIRIYRKNETELATQLSEGKITQEQRAELLVELQRNLIADQEALKSSVARPSRDFGRYAVIGLSLIVLISGFGYYYKKGAIADVAVYQLQQEKMELDYKDMLQNNPASPERAKKLAEAYEERVAAKPESIQYWFLLARTKMELSAYSDAVAAYQEVLKRDKESPMIMAEAAQALFLRDGNQTGTEVVNLAKSALTLEPENTMAMGLLGIAAYNDKDYKACIRYWQKAVDLLGPNSQGAQALAAGIDKAKAAYVAAGGKLEDLSAKSIYALTLEVRLGAKVKAKPDQVVFVYARAFQGMPMPLAIQRLKVSDLPITIQLDESMAMSPAASLANIDKVEVLARVSESGSAQAKAGDWIARQGPVEMKAIPEKIVLEINEQYQGN